MCVCVFAAEFEAKYQQLNQLGEGGCGSVFAGYRKADNLPVGVTHFLKYAHTQTHTQCGQEMLTPVPFVSRRLPSNTYHKTMSRANIW